jgi:acylphosphatase
LSSPFRPLVLITLIIFTPIIKNMIEAILSISGRVQGVGFRESARRTLSGMGMTGFVRNLAVGGVEAIVECESPRELDDAVAKLRKAPLPIEVREIAVSGVREIGKRRFWEFSIGR